MALLIEGFKGFIPSKFLIRLMISLAPWYLLLVLNSDELPSILGS